MKKLLAAFFLISGIGLFALSSSSSAAPLPDGAEAQAGSDKDCTQACSTCQKACTNLPDSGKPNCMSACTTVAGGCCTAYGKKAPTGTGCECQ